MAIRTGPPTPVKATALAALLLVLLGGCSRLRFVVDAVPSEDAITETVVIEAPARGRGWGRTAKVVLLDVDGLIVDARRSGFVADGENPVARFAESLRRAAADRAVKAVIVRINSPGGTVTASDVCYRELNRFRGTTGIPVVILMADVAASGGYYLACAGDEIIAHPTTVTGSIGVIMQTVSFSEGMRRIGVKADAITSGPNKALASPLEPMSAEHRAILQGMVDEFYAGFLDVVMASRPGIAKEDVAWITDGRVVTGAQAARIGVVDGLGDLHDAFDAAKRRAGVSRARLVKYHRPLEHVGSVYAAAAPPLPMLQVNVASPPGAETAGFYYLWDPMVW